MFDTAIAYLESKTPTWIKVIIALAILGWMTPLKVREWAFELIDTRVHAVVTPMKVARDGEIKDLYTRLNFLQNTTNETNAFVKAIAVKQLGTAHYKEVELTRVEKTE